MNESDKIYKNIGEVVKILELRSKKGNKNPTHTIRYWEKEFKQLNPKILNGKRRYYDEKNINLLKKIKYLLKDQGMTINGVKKILNNKEPLKLDEMSNHSIKASNLLGFPVSSKTKLDNVTSSVLARKVSAILSASTLLAPLTTSFTSASSLFINAPSRVKSLTICTGTILNNCDFICSIVSDVPLVTSDILDKFRILSISVTVKLSIL